MDDNKRNRILDKLRKLTDLRDSAKALGNEGEANAAAAGISRLLLEYNLSEEDIPLTEREENPVVMEEIPYCSKYYKGNWHERLVDILCENNLCRGLIRSVQKEGNVRRSRNSLLVVGRKKNVEVVLYLSDFLAFNFVRIGKNKYPAYKHDSVFVHGKYPESETRFMQSFLYGCLSGLYEQYNRLKQEIKRNQPSTTALAIRVEEEISDFLSTMKIGKGRDSKIPEINAEAYQQGYQTGESINLQSGLEEKGRRGQRFIG